MNILLIGGAGYIGSALTPHLLSLSHKITIADLLWFGGESLNFNADLWRVDAATITSRDLRGFDAVIFLAGLSNDPMAEFAPHLNFTYNAALPAYLAHESRLAGVRTFIHAGSCSIYGFDRAVTESTLPKTFSPYGTSKLMGEIGCLQQGQDSMRVVAFRMGTVCGPSPRLRLDLIINAMVKDAIMKREIIVNDGEAERPILNIYDAVGCYSHALISKEIAGIYNLVSENASVFYIAQQVQRIVAEQLKKPIAINLLGKQEVRSYSASNEKALRAGFSFTRDIEYTVAQTFQSLLEDTRDLESNRFYNIRSFKNLDLTAHS